MPTVEEAKHRLDLVPKGHQVAVAIWEEEDVLGYAKQVGLKCSRKLAREVIDEIDRKQDCELGINWMTIDVYLREH